MKKAKYIYFCHILLLGWDIAIFLIWRELTVEGWNWGWENHHISSHEPKNKKVRALCFIQFLKFKKAKCLHFCHFWLLAWDIAIFWIWWELLVNGLNQDWESSNISAPEPKFIKVRTLCFLELLKLKKAKCLYFCHFWVLGWDIAIFWIWRELSINGLNQEW